MAKKRQKKPSKATQRATWADVALRAMDIVWRAFDNGQLQELIFLAIVVVFGIGLWRMEPQDIGPLLRDFLQLFASQITLAGMFVAVIASMAYCWSYQVKSLRREIQRLADEKSYWVHGEKHIKGHRTSGFNWGKDEESEDGNG